MSDKERLQRISSADTRRILTLPNVLSILRIAMIPLIIVLFERDHYWWAAGMVFLSGVTDVVDGWIARHFHLVSDFGKALDPLADKLTQAAVLLCLLPMKHWWVVGLLAVKEIAIGSLSLYTIRRTKTVYGAGWYGKLCTAFIYASMFVLILWQAPPERFVLFDAIACAALILLSFVMYVRRFVGILKEARIDDAYDKA
ncbi:MAG: CDP-alcohol phosphatidyltransferase family protein [Oscillospiraceae bacterium]|jgi:cardiolipin synthase|nr:CDP-alcohol phosphatidyltransferase family protein [Oscillospiraceae bacterium]